MKCFRISSYQKFIIVKCVDSVENSNISPVGTYVDLNIDT